MELNLRIFHLFNLICISNKKRPIHFHGPISDHFTVWQTPLTIWWIIFTKCEGLLNIHSHSHYCQPKKVFPVKAHLQWKNINGNFYVKMCPSLAINFYILARKSQHFFNHKKKKSFFICHLREEIYQNRWKRIFQGISKVKVSGKQLH